MSTLPCGKVRPPNLVHLLLLLALLACASAAAVEAQRRAGADAGVVAVLGIPEETELPAAKLVRPAAADSSLFVSEPVFQPGRIPRATGPAAREWKCAFELAFGEGSPYAAKFPSLYELPYDTNLSITKEVLDRVVPIALAETGARRLSLAYLPGGFESFPVVPSAQLDARATEAQTRAALDVIGYLAQQSLVLASARAPSGDRAALHVTQTAGADLASPAGVQKFWRRVSALEPKLNPGFSGTLAAGRPGLFIIDTDGDWLPSDREKFDAAAAAASKEQKVTTSVEHLRVVYVSAGNEWKRYPKGEQYLKRLGDAGRRALAAKLERVYRPRVERWIAEAFKRRGLGPGARPHAVPKPPAQPSSPPPQARKFAAG